jgi:hypothetical protein
MVMVPELLAGEHLLRRDELLMISREQLASVPELLAGEHLLRSDELLMSSMEQLARDRAITSSLPPSQFHLINADKTIKNVHCP